MKKWIAIISVLALCFCSLFAAQNNISVPITSDVYRVIDNAVIRGIIPSQAEVKPYSYSKLKETRYNPLLLLKWNQKT